MRMAWRKSPPDLIAAFDAALPDDRRVQRRSMFGYPCAFARGNMFTGLHQESLIVRLPEEERARLLRHPGASIFSPMPGRVMKEYVAVPPEIVDDEEALRRWMTISLDYAASLPAKGRKGAGKASGGQDASRVLRAGKVRRGSTASKVRASAGARSTRGARGR
jgi:TfoX/Sxy family transcriptional regulator of competence genes